jgi:hypothetical protein
MLKKIASMFLFSALFLLSSCGSEGDETAFITYLVTVNTGNIAEVIYLNDRGEEVQTTGPPGKRTFTVSFPAKEGTFLYLLAGAEQAGDTVNISARILSNGSVVNEGNNDGDTGPPALRPQIALEAFATIPKEVDTQ